MAIRNDAAPRERSRRASAPLRWIGYVGVFVVGFFAYWLSDLFLDKYIGFGLSWIIVGVMSVVALVIWIVDERRLAGEAEDTMREDG